jgi:hypothetical protein
VIAIEVQADKHYIIKILSLIKMLNKICSGCLPTNRVVCRVMGTSDVFNKSIISINTKRQI